MLYRGPRMSFSWRAMAAGVLGAGCLTIAAVGKRDGVPTPHGLPAAQRVTFNHHIAPLRFLYGAPCHHPGEAGPFPLLTYADAKSHARQIAAVTSKRIMPPWLPEPQ